STRRECQIGLEQALELEEGLVVENDVVHVLDRDAAGGEAIVDRPGGKIGIVPLARKPLFLGRGNDLAVAHQGGGAVVVEGGEPENSHNANRLRPCCAARFPATPPPSTTS